MSDAQTLITKYRPQTFEEIFGHQDVIASLSRAIAAPTHPHCYLLTGASGLGKTTMARIIGHMFECEILEIDAATNSGIDHMRQLVEMSQHRAMTGNGNRMFIIDECHALSRNAWQAILKLSEEPPAHVYIALCTTDPSKVPDTIKLQRAFPVVLRRLPINTLTEYAELIREMEGWPPINNDVLAAVVTGADGSPRKTLTLLNSLHDARSREEVNRVISLLDAGDSMIEVIQLIMKGDTAWNKVKLPLSRIEDDEFENAAIIASRYIIGAIMREDHAQKVTKLFGLLQALTFPTDTFDKKTAFFVAIGRMLGY